MSKDKDKHIPEVDPAKDYFNVFGLKYGATKKEIKKKYRKLCMKYHPDRNPTRKEWAEEKFKEINEAYIILTTKESFDKIEAMHEEKKREKERMEQMTKQQREMKEKLEAKEKAHLFKKQEESNAELLKKIKETGGYDELYQIMREHEDKQRERIRKRQRVQNFN